MSRCVNEDCKNDPLNSMNAVIVSIDGDMACCPECKRKYESQKRHFLDHVIQDDKKFKEWFGEFGTLME
jgi:hypothetical protein